MYGTAVTVSYIWSLNDTVKNMLRYDKKI